MFTDNLMYWANKAVPANEIIFTDTQPYHQPRRIYDNEAYAVEATAYAMMTYLRRNVTQATPIMQWLQTMRNTYAGQSSTQVRPAPHKCLPFSLHSCLAVLLYLGAHHYLWKRGPKI